MDRDALLDRYGAGFAIVAEALEGISEAELDRHGPEGGWTPRQVAHHLADSEATAYVRLRRVIAEDGPLIIGYDEEAFARRLHYDRPVASALAVLSAVRTASLELLEALAPSEWDRAGSHSESGRYSVDGWLQTYADHPRDHAAQIRLARGT